MKKNPAMICSRFMAAYIIGSFAFLLLHFSAYAEGEMIPLAMRGGVTFQVYEVKPVESRGSAVLLIHDREGLDDQVKSIADQLALLGYHALAVDLFQAKTEGMPSRLEAVLDYLALTSTKIGIIGWDTGASWALKASLARPEQVSATVIYYGEPVPDPHKLKGLKGPVLGIFAKRDSWIIPAWVEAFQTALGQAGIPCEIYSYDADHGFAKPGSRYFDETAYRDAWEKTLEFLKKNLMNTSTSNG